MPVSGLILTLKSEGSLAPAEISNPPGGATLELGQRTGRWIPAVLETRDDEEGQRVHAWLATVPGIEYVDVVYVNFVDYTPNEGTSSAHEGELVRAV